MFNTAFTFGLTQFARSLSMPERLHKRPFRNATLEPWRFRNSSLDAIFYDIKTLTADEAFYISDSLAAEGMLMIVPPTGQGMLTLCDSVDEYLLRGGRDVHVMAVAGLGGSAAGAAAFARNVADAVNAPVAAVVSGYGLGDILSEAMGGNFFFGPLGFLRHNFEMIDDLVGRPQLGDYKRRAGDLKTPRPVSLDTDTVEALLMHKDLRFNLVTGHSKGNLIIAEALASLETEARERLEAIADDLQVISFATRIAVPAAIAPALSIMGELDWYGELNATAPAANSVRVPRSGHSTNTDMPGSLKITSLLRDALGKIQKQDKEAPKAAAAPEPEKAPVLHLVPTPSQKAADAPVEAEIEQVAAAEAPLVEQPALEAAVAETPVPSPVIEPAPIPELSAEPEPVTPVSAPEPSAPAQTVPASATPAVAKISAPPRARSGRNRKK